MTLSFRFLSMNSRDPRLSFAGDCGCRYDASHSTAEACAPPSLTRSLQDPSLPSYFGVSGDGPHLLLLFSSLPFSLLSSRAQGKRQSSDRETPSYCNYAQLLVKCVVWRRVREEGVRDWQRVQLRSRRTGIEDRVASIAGSSSHASRRISRTQA